METIHRYKKEAVGIGILLFLWLFAAFPLFGNRFIPTHDGEYHLIRIYEFSKMLREGHIFPRWAPGLNSGYGFPLFIFHYPFPNYVGSLFFLLGFPLVQSFQYSLGMSLFVAMIGCYIFLRRYYSVISSVFGVVLFFSVPYLYVDVYVRGSIGELWAIAWTWCALASIVWRRVILFSLCIALIIVSHNIMAMIMIPFLTIFTELFYRNAFISLIGGIGLSAYFWIPALFERQYVIGLNTVTYSDHFPHITQLLFPSWGTNFSQPGIIAGEISQQIGIVPLVILLVSFIFLWKQHSPIRLVFFVFSFIGIFFLLPMSDFIWRIISFLQFIQYPWRLLSILLITIPFLGAFFVRRITSLILFGGIAIVLSFSYMRPVAYEPREDSYYLNNPSFTDGTSSLGNSFSTIWTPWIRERYTSVVSGGGKIRNVQETSISVSFSVETNQETSLRIHRTYYPGWRIIANGREIPVDYSRGVIDINLPERGVYNVEAIFEETQTRRSANALSLITLSLMINFVVFRYFYARRNKYLAAS